MPDRIDRLLLGNIIDEGFAAFTASDVPAIPVGMRRVGQVSAVSAPPNDGLAAEQAELA